MPNFNTIFARGARQLLIVTQARRKGSEKKQPFCVKKHNSINQFWPLKYIAIEKI
jgi:hypothetical protein